MAFELIAAIIAAVGMAGIALLVRRFLAPALPRWAMTLSAAAGLIGCTIILEYGWFARVSRALPEGVTVVWQDDRPQALRPWSMAFPLVTRFTALDLRGGGAHPANPDLRLWPIYQFARWQPVQQGMMLFDCAGGTRVLVTEGVSVDDAGQMTGGAWLAADDTVQSAACAG